MQRIVNFIVSSINYCSIDSSLIQNLHACINEEMKVDGWISLILSNREGVVLKFNNGVFLKEGYVLNDEKVLKVLGNGTVAEISCNKESMVEGIVDLDSGTRCEGRLLIKGEMGIPFGFGEMYDDDGKLKYKGIMINWKRFGYGVNYHDNGEIEYEGYWCDNNRCGNGKAYDRQGRLMKECGWYNGNESITDYEGNGSKPINIGIKHLKLSDNCLLKDWNISWLLNLESIEIGDNYFESVQTFKIEGLNQLKSLKIGKNSFTHRKYSFGNHISKSFHILKCKLLETIEIGEFSFNDFGGQFELKDLPKLCSIKIGEIGSYSCNFYSSSFVIRGTSHIVNLF